MGDHELSVLRVKLSYLEQRCGWLAREAWLWRLGAVAAFVAIGVLFRPKEQPVTAPKEIHFDAVRVRDFSVVDQMGRDRVRIYVDQTGTTMLTVNSRDKNRIVLAASDDGGLVLVKDEQERTRLVAKVNAEGPRLEILSAEDKPLATVLSGNHGGHVILGDKTGNPQVRLGVGDGETGLSLHDSMARNRANLLINSFGRPQMTLRDEAAKASVVAGWFVAEDRGPMLVMLDEKGEIRSAFGLVRQDRDLTKLRPTLRLNDENGEALFSKP